MPQWFTNGGWPMWFLLVVGALAVIAAADFAWRPDPTRLERIRALARAEAWGVVTGTAAAFGAVGLQIPSNPEWAHNPDIHLLVLQGFGESMSPALLGGAVLSVVALLCAAGHGRMQAHGSAP
jgi:hypothetical protein